MNDKFETVLDNNEEFFFTDDDEEFNESELHQLENEIKEIDKSISIFFNIKDYCNILALNICEKLKLEDVQKLINFKIA
jgi:hypothetical protein